MPIRTAFPFDPDGRKPSLRNLARGKINLFLRDCRVRACNSAKKIIFAMDCRHLKAMETTVEEQIAITPSLCEAVARLMPQLSAHLGAPSAGLLRRLCASPAAALLVARQDGRIVGMLTLAWYDAPSGRKAWIEDVVVDAAARGFGAGAALVRAAQAHAAAVGAGKVMLTSNPSRGAARRLYAKMGFKEAETTVFACKTDTE